MLVLGVLSLLVASAGAQSGDTAAFRAFHGDTASVIAPSTQATDRTPAPTWAAPPDTLRQRRKAVEVSEWYSRRLTIHRYVAYATVPVFGLQYAAGTQLFQKGATAPEWAKSEHFPKLGVNGASSRQQR